MCVCVCSSFVCVFKNFFCVLVGLDFYSCVKLINYIRKEVSQLICTTLHMRIHQIVASYLPQ